MTVTPDAVFIGGCPRSGTTLLASLLGGLPGCVVTPESQFKQKPLETLHRNPCARLDGAELGSQLSKHLRFRHWEVELPTEQLQGSLGQPELRNLLLTLVARVGQRQHRQATCTTWIDHTPQNIEMGLALSTVFPNSRMIHIIRDPRAVAASLLPLDWGPHSPTGVARLWSHRLAHGLSLESSLEGRIRRVRYEDICQEPERILQELGAWLGLAAPEGDSGLNPVSSFLPAYTLHQHGLIGKRPQADRVSAWRAELDPWEQRELENRLGQLMSLTGYPPEWETKPHEEPRVGPWRRRVLPLLKAARGRLRHRRHQRKQH